jgi:glycosyltransferase involved in cell wall biosynthesis
MIVSICCQTFNHVHFIEQCLESFLMQKANFRFEILLRDDASTDGTAEICQAYANKYPDIIKLLAYKENQFAKGIKPMQDNVKRAQGKYIALCDGDDYWTDPYKLQKQVDFLEANEAYSGSYTDTLLLDKDNFSPWRKDLPSAMSLRDVISLYSPFHTSSFLFKKDAGCLETFDQFKEINSNDMLLFALVAEKGNLVKIDCQPTVYRKHVGGVTNLQRNKSLSLHFSRMILWGKIKEVIPREHNKMDSIISQHMLLALALLKTPLRALVEEIGYKELIKMIGKKTFLKHILFAR